ncbi:MAG: cupin domain-containing protein [Deltaproteobacteria bacterium]|nr:cupin domain-containing protein [Deltaproteobacteria bacterium]
MTVSTARVVTGGVLALAAAYLVLGNLVHHVVSPLTPPDPHELFAAGDRFSSAAEGVHQEVLGLDGDGWIRLRLQVDPGAEGPPLHVHHGFDEHFVVTEGVLSVEYGDGVRTLKAGDELLVPAGTPHRPFNPHAEAVTVEGPGPTMPGTFAACLALLYPAMEAGGPAVPLQLSVLGDDCDTHIAEMPRPVELAMRAVLAPAGRLLGFGWTPRG